MSNIEVGASLIPGTVDTPLDGRGRVVTEADIADIRQPFIGMVVYVQDSGKRYIVRSLKAKQIGSLLVENAAVDQYEELRAAGAFPASITLPIPYDDNEDNISLVLDVSTQPGFAEGTYTRITMSVWYAKMHVFNPSEEGFIPLAEKSVGVPFYGSSVTFTLDNEMFPDYEPGETYFARFSWIDTRGGYRDWAGFKFTGDVSDLEPIHTDYEKQPKVKDSTSASGNLSLDYLEGEIQNYTMLTDVMVSLANVSNVPFGEALIVNMSRISGTLTVTSGNSSQTYTETKTYMIVITNFGALNIAVTETV